ncbi:phosphatidylglycerol lysyltransferase domain-containing protein [Xenophilus arseniciresistens]|uniref:Phosphatidylglycerol lysyltransferase domain-containing protein n=1 Tax=Xenophilus arseniciresistens TaxID=1283306 RepID=A0AAE3N6X4_9BURK|nr:phosphatidylglycerol lysyltransferase domain-containing protein [Xenophilus arseniciresistens]MDA7416003.1 phosphatidylglycerol lysyltransferase domain-containing protein [Xenophilus arseniciresistens]
MTLRVDVNVSGGVSAGEPLALAHAARVAPLLAERQAGQGERAIADLSFANLWLFRRAHDYRFCDGPWPLIRGRAYDGQRHAIPLFPLGEAPPSVLRALLAPGECFFPLAEAQALALPPARFAFSASRDDADYLYRAQAFVDYAGAGLHNKRNLLKQCLAAHRLHHAPYTPQHQPLALQILRDWLQEKGKQAGEADDLPCQEALQHAPALGLEGFISWADGEPAGFVLAEPLQSGVCVLRFAKALARFKGLSQALFSHFAQNYPLQFGRPLDWLNFEQDMGLPNFRRTKLSYQPQALLHKLRAVPR